jgi:hypothetical protein
MVVILSFSVSVVLYLFLAKNGSNNREFFNTKFDENEVNDELTKIKNMNSDIVRVSNSMETKLTELKEIKIEKNKLIEKLEVAKKDADKRKVDQKIFSIATPAGELPPHPVIAKTEIKQLVETINDNVKKIADAKKFDEKMLKNSAIGLNDELRKFLENKEKEALNNPDFKAKYGREWVAIANDLKNNGKELVNNRLKISQILDLPKTKEGMGGLKTLLLQTKVEQLNFYFAFDYFATNKSKLLKMFDNEGEKEKKSNDTKKNEVEKEKKSNDTKKAENDEFKKFLVDEKTAFQKLINAYDVFLGKLKEENK